MSLRANHFYFLSLRPLIAVYLPMSSDLFDVDYLTLFKRNAPATLLQNLFSWVGTEEEMMKYRKLQDFLFEQGIEHHLIVSAADEEILRIKCGVRGAHFSQNIYINQHVFNVGHCSKIYDAVYTAQFLAVKRMELAQKINKLMVLSYGGDLHAYCSALKHADFNTHFLDRAEVAAIIQQSHTGLCLSAIEGSMFASIEYLMCGVPVVTTPSKGGRDEFFTRTNSITTDADSSLISAAVECWKKNPPDADKIRRETFEQVGAIRYQYSQYVAQLMQQPGSPKVDPDRLQESYFNHPDGFYRRGIHINDLGDARSLSRFSFEFGHEIPHQAADVSIDVSNDSCSMSNASVRDLKCNEQMLFVWNLCNGVRSVDDIIDLIAREFAEPENTIRPEVIEALQSLHRNKMLLLAS